MPESDSVNLSLRDYLGIVRRRVWVVVNTFILLTTLGVIAVIMTPSVFRSHGRLLLWTGSTFGGSNNNSDLLASVLSSSASNSMETQLQLLQDPSLLGQVYQQVHVAGSSMPSNITVNQVGATNLVDVVAEGRDPRALADVINTLMRTYLAQQQQAIVLRLNKAAQFLQEESQRALADLGIAEQKLYDYQRAHGVPNTLISMAPMGGGQIGSVNTDPQSQLMMYRSRIARLKGQIAAAQVQLKKEPSTVKQKVTQADAAVAAAISDINTLQVKRALLLSNYQPTMPQVRALDSQIKALQNFISSRPATTSSTVDVPNPARSAIAGSIAKWETELSGTVDAQSYLQQQLAQSNAKSTAGGTGETEYLQLSRNVDTTTGQYITFSNRLQDIRLLERATPSAGSVIEQANPSYVPIRPQRGFLIGVVGIGALTLSLGLIFLLELMDDRIKRPEELEMITGLATLGYISEMEDKKTRLLINGAAHLPQVENYRVLRTNITFASVDHSIRSLLITSTVDSEGKSLTSANLAVVMAMEGRRVVLVDADLRKPGLHSLFEMGQSPGLAELLNGTGALRQCVHETMVPNLYLIPAGEIHGFPAEMLGNPVISDLLMELKHYYDLVILDSPPCLQAADATLLAARADATLMVYDPALTRRHLIRESLAMLARARARVLGSVVNRADRLLRYGYYPYSYYSYSSTPAEGAPSSVTGNGRALPPRISEGLRPIESLPDEPFRS